MKISVYNNQVCCSNFIKVKDIEIKQDFRLSNEEEESKLMMLTQSDCLLSKNFVQKQNEYIDKYIKNVNIVERKKRLKEASEKAPKLYLKVMYSTCLPKNSIILINPLGLIGGYRNFLDGYSYFGCKKRNIKKNESSHSEIINDFIIPIQDKETSERLRGQHFRIEFNLEKNSYFIQDLGIGHGAFVKIEGSHIIKDNQMIGIGESFIIFNIIGEIHDSDVLLRLKLFAGLNDEDVFYFNKSYQKIKIGRVLECEVSIEDPLLSKNQAHIIFDNALGWLICDGDEGVKSTNGTWLYASDSIELKNEMLFKVDQGLFQVKI